VKSVSWQGENILCGTKDGEVIEINVHQRDKPVVLSQVFVPKAA
jgi:hypothetical protein